MGTVVGGLRDAGDALPEARECFAPPSEALSARGACVGSDHTHRPTIAAGVERGGGSGESKLPDWSASQASHRS